MKTARAATVNSLLAFLVSLTDEEKLALTDNPGKVKKFLYGLATESADNTFVLALSDTELKEQFPKLVDMLQPWRKYAAVMGYTGPVAWEVKAGFTLKEHAPIAGPCHQKFTYLQDWNLKNDEATKDSIVFWIPRLAENSTGKTIKEMEEIQLGYRATYELPQGHGRSFGSIALLMALVLAHFKRTGERVPLEMLYTTSDTLSVGGSRLCAGGFDGHGLDCNDWYEYAFDYVGFFLLGVEVLGQ